MGSIVMPEGKPWQWQHTRCRIGAVDFHGDENVIQIVQTDEHAMNILSRVYQHLSSGHVAGLMVGVVLADRSTVTAFDSGSASYSDMVGLAEMLKFRLLVKTAG